MVEVQLAAAERASVLATDVLMSCRFITFDAPAGMTLYAS